MTSCDRQPGWFQQGACVPDVYARSEDAEFVLDFDGDETPDWSSLDWRECNVPANEFCLAYPSIEEWVMALPGVRINEEMTRIGEIRAWVARAGGIEAALAQSPLLITFRDGRVKIEDGYHRLGVAILDHGLNCVRALCAEVTPCAAKPQLRKGFDLIEQKGVGKMNISADEVSTLRAKWMEIEYDSIMTNGAGVDVWHHVKQRADSMSVDELIERLDDMEVFDEDNPRPLYTAAPVDADVRLQDAVTKAQAAFWSALVSSYPEIKTGDFSPGAELAFDAACAAAAETWVESNRPKTQEPAKPKRSLSLGM